MSNTLKQNTCPHAKKCSGCQLQNLTYEEQLRMKQVKLIGLLGKFGHVNEIIGMEDPTHYRNKVQSAFAMRGGRIISGVYQSTTRSIVPVDECMLEDKICDRIIVTVRGLCKKYNILPYDMRSGKGYLHHVLVRRGFVSGEVMVVLVTGKGELRRREEFTRELLALHPEITTLVRNITTAEGGLFLGDSDEILFGNGYINETLCGLSFRISPRSFFQVNPVQTEILYSTAVKFAGLTGKEKLIDAYCGTGTIGLIMARGAAEVTGVEVNEDAVRDAVENARLNGIENVRFHAADAGRFMDELSSKEKSVDVVITDPPRAGCSQKFLKSLINLAPRKVVYISCNPETLARDLFTLTKNGYRVKKIQPVDMFPHTNHCEVVCQLIRVSGK